jgi:HSP20 family molecular chaperone IbpA
MTRVSLFSHPLLLGFEEFERTLERITKTAGDGYPPYNIEQVDENRLRITLAVAGFEADELSVHVEDSQLIIRGRREDGGERVFLHRGIAARQFQRVFVLAEGLEVAAATLASGLLHIDAMRPKPEARVRRIEIKSVGDAVPGRRE